MTPLTSSVPVQQGSEGATISHAVRSIQPAGTLLCTCAAATAVQAPRCRSQPTRQPLSCAAAQPSRPHLTSGTRACGLSRGSPAAGLALLPLPPAARPSRSRRSQSRRGSRQRYDQTPGSGEGGHTQFLTVNCTVVRPCWSWPCHAVWRQEAFACPGERALEYASDPDKAATQHSTAPHSATQHSAPPPAAGGASRCCTAGPSRL